MSQLYDNPSYLNAHFCCRQKFADLPENDQCDLLGLIGKFPCALSGLLRPCSQEAASEFDFLLCSLCDGGECAIPTSPEEVFQRAGELRDAFANLLPKLSRAPNVRIAAMLTLQRMSSHGSQHGQMHLASSVHGEFLHQSLRSSVRELRLTTGYFRPPDMLG